MVKVEDDLAAGATGEIEDDDNCRIALAPGDL
jgi:hypothetical protein